MSDPLTVQIRPLLRFQGITGLTGGGSTKLDGIATLALTVPITGIAVVSGVAYVYQLRTGTDAESSPNIIRPDDYNGGSNAKVWDLLEINISQNTDITLTGRLTAAKWSNTQSALTYAGTTNLDFDGGGARTLALTGNVTFTTSNKAAGRMLKLFITADATRNFTYPAWIGDDDLPASIDSTQTVVLVLECTGTTDALVVASAKVLNT